MKTYVNQLEAVKLLKDWSAWLVTIQAAAIGLVTLFYEDGLTLNFWSRGATTFFALSIIVATLVLGGLPSVVQRVTPNVRIHDMQLTEWLPGGLFIYTFLQHLFFILGVIFLMRYQWIST